jgi:hypothetical protein
VAKAAKVATTTNAKASIRKIEIRSIIPVPIWDTKLRVCSLDHINCWVEGETKKFGSPAEPLLRYQPSRGRNS